MKLKTIKASFIEFETKLGRDVFSNVPVSVTDDTAEESFDPEKDEYFLSGDIIKKMSREIAKRWLKEFLRTDEDGNWIRRGVMTPDEIHGVQLVLGLNNQEMAHLLGFRSRANITKILQGSHSLNPTSTRLLLMILKDELRRPGAGKRHLRVPYISAGTIQTDLQKMA